MVRKKRENVCRDADKMTSRFIGGGGERACGRDVRYRQVETIRIELISRGLTPLVCPVPHRDLVTMTAIYATAPRASRLHAALSVGI